MNFTNLRKQDITHRASRDTVVRPVIKKGGKLHHADNIQIANYKNIISIPSEPERVPISNPPLARIETVKTNMSFGAKYNVSASAISSKPDVSFKDNSGDNTSMGLMPTTESTKHEMTFGSRGGISNSSVTKISKSDFRGNRGSRGFLSNFGMRNTSGSTEFTYFRKGDSELFNNTDIETTNNEETMQINELMQTHS